MLSLDEINNTIEELQNSNTTFDNCSKLASLYIVKEHLENADLTGNFNKSAVVKEYNDILPKYHQYVDIKTQFQLGKISATSIETSIRQVCDEISEFLTTMYNCTDMQIERDFILNMVRNLPFLPL